MFQPPTSIYGSVEVWMETVDIDPQECNKELATYHSWFVSHLDLQSDSYTHLRNGVAPLLPPRYFYLTFQNM